MNKKHMLLIALICPTFMQIFAADEISPESSATNPMYSPKTNQYSGTKSVSSPVGQLEGGFPSPSKIAGIYHQSPDLAAATSPASSKRSASPAGPAPKKSKNGSDETPPASPSEHGLGFYDFPKVEYGIPKNPVSMGKAEKEAAGYIYGNASKTPEAYTPSPTQTTESIKNPFAVGIYQIQNTKRGNMPQQDYYQTLPTVDPKTGLTQEPIELINAIPYQLYGVYDGHGIVGELVAHKVSSKLLGYIAGNIRELTQSGHAFPTDQALINTAITQSFEKIDREVNQTYEGGGTTAIVALVHGNKVTIANAGDSRAVIASYPTTTPGSILHAQLLLATQDHKPGPPQAEAGPARENEFSRLKKLGIIPLTSSSQGAVWRIGTRENSIAVSRSIGDKQFESFGMIARPEIYELTLTPEMENPFIILACDGVWDVMDNQDAADLVASSLERNQNDGTIAAQQLVNHARALDSVDDLTTIIVPIRLIDSTIESEQAGRASAQ